MGSSESIFNNSASPVEVWFQFDDGLCPSDGCMHMTLQPGSTTGKKSFRVNSANQVCVKYAGPSGQKMVCRNVISPSHSGQTDTYSVGDIIGRTSLSLKPHGEYPLVFVAPFLASIILALIGLKIFFFSSKRPRNLSELEESLVNGETDEEDLGGGAGSPRNSSKRKASKRQASKLSAHRDLLSQLQDTCTRDAGRTPAQRRWAKVRILAFAIAEEKRRKKSEVWKSLIVFARKCADKMRREKLSKYENAEGLDYAEIDNESWRSFILNLNLSARRMQTVMEYIMVVSIGITTGLVTKSLMAGIEFMGAAKMKFILPYYSHQPIMAGFMYVGCNTLLFILASIPCVFFRPSASGGGIPEVKAYLNGCWIQGFFSSSTMLAKFTSVLFSVTAGMPLGPEAPIIHLGACIGNLHSSTEMMEKLKSFFQFENYLEFRKVCMTMGVAAGVSAAFGAPIGGLLFTCEEILALNKAQQWYAFLASLSSYTVVRLLQGGDAKGTFAVDSGHWNTWEIGLVFILGVAMGLIGALFSSWNIYVLSHWRIPKINKFKNRKIMEVAAIAVCVSIIWHVVPILFDCIPMNEGASAWENTSSLWCDDPDTQWNPFSTLLLSPLDIQVQQIFIRGDVDHGLTPAITVTYGVIFACLAGFIAGSHVASGIFVPMFVIGGSIGRGYGRMLQAMYPDWGINCGAYAIAGTAGFLGGVTHMSIALSVVLLEITNDFAFLLPIMVSIGCAKVVSSAITQPLFDKQIELKHIPFLEDTATLMMHKIRCSHCMARGVEMLPVHTTVRDILEKLTATHHNHNGFPCVDEKGKLRGLILRAHLVAILKERLFEGDADQQYKNAIKYEPMEWRLMVEKQENLKIKVSDFEFSPQDLDAFVDLMNFMSRAPPSILSERSASSAFEMFVGSNLRHLPVVDRHNKVVGMITRHELVDVQLYESSYEQFTKERHLDVDVLMKQAKATETMMAARKSQVVSNESVQSPEWTKSNESVQSPHSDGTTGQIPHSGRAITGLTTQMFRDEQERDEQGKANLKASAGQMAASLWLNGTSSRSTL